MSRAWSLLIVLAIWGVIYLPRLGSLEIKGEEGRRILPAVTMLETGNYIVPQVGSEPYFRKPPLVNWLVAASFTLCHRHNEFAARLPSVLCVLAVAIAFITIAQPSLGTSGSLVAAIIWLTNFGMIEKGRLIEIEALYVSLSGLATICWLSWWREKRSPWLTWIVPWIFLGLGLLAKGPTHLLFFYAVVIAVLWSAGEMRTLLRFPHLVGLLVMLALFAAWAVPCLEMMRASPVAQIWSRQLSGRLSGEDFKLLGWLSNIPRGLGYLLPWTILLPFMRFDRVENEDERKFLCAISWGVAISFVAVSLLPGSLPRYTMPLLVPTIWLLARSLTLRALAWPKEPLRFVGITAAIMAAAMLIYSTAIIPILQRREKVRTIAQQINALVPKTDAIYAVDPAYQPFLFYVQRKLIYVSRIEELPQDARYLLIQPANEEALEKSERWPPLRARPVLRIADYRNRKSLLLRVSAP
jgi:4-amino-4-deoxy-L-arabinose transferase-like glycosyltransferase